MSDFYKDITEIRISDSSLATFRSCPRKFEFRKIYMHSERDRNINTETGKAMHEAYQCWFVTRDRDAAIAKLCEHYPWDLNNTGFEAKSPEACYYTLEVMMSNEQMLDYEIAQIQCADGVVRPAIEVPFEIEILGFDLVPGRPIKIVYVGLIDMILFDLFYSKYHVLDIKTHGDNKDDLTPKYKFRPQPLPYGLVLQQAIGKDFESFVVNYLSARIHIEEPKVKLYPFDKSFADVKEWAFDLWCDLQAMSMYMQVGKWKRNGGDACMSWNSLCKFYDICEKRDPVAIKQEIEMYTFVQDKFPEPWIRTKLELTE